MLEKRRNTLNAWTTHLYARVQVAKETAWNAMAAKFRNEKGGVSLEWIALGLVTFGILAAVGAWFKSNTENGKGMGSLAEAIVNALSKVFAGVEVTPGSGGNTGGK